MGFDGPPRHTGKVPSESCAAPTTFMGFLAPTATSARRSTHPGFHTRYGPPSGFPTLLTVYSLRTFRPRRIGATHGVHPAELFPSAEPYASRRLCPHAVSGIAYSCSENQKFTMPRDSRALLPAEIRTPHGRSRLRADTLLGFCRLSRAFPSCRRTGFPVPSLMRFVHQTCGRPGGRRSRASTITRVDRPSRNDQLS
jgi:hypothetical protein